MFQTNLTKDQTKNIHSNELALLRLKTTSSYFYQVSSNFFIDLNPGNDDVTK